MMRGYLRLELQRIARSPGFLVLTMVLPLVMYLIFTNLNTVTGLSRDYAARYATVSVGAYSAIGVLLNFGAAIVTDRAIGWLRNLRLTPMSPPRVVFGKAATGMLLVLPPVLLLCGLAVTVNHVRLTPGQWLAVIPMLWLGSLPFALLGLGIGYRCSVQTAQLANFVAYFGLSILGGLLLPLQSFPGWLRFIGRYTPTHGYADLAARVLGTNDSSLGQDLATLTVWTLLFALVALRAYRRSAARLGG
jgi:ABC-2 type transport system permease protein